MTDDELLLERLEAETAGVEIYKAALQCAWDDEVRERWRALLEQAEERVANVRQLCERLQIDRGSASARRLAVRGIGAALVRAIEIAKEGGEDAARRLSIDCVILANANESLDWKAFDDFRDAAAVEIPSPEKTAA